MERINLQRKQTLNHKQSVINPSLRQLTTNIIPAQPTQASTAENIKPQDGHNFEDIKIFADEHTVQRKASQTTVDAIQPNLNLRIQASLGGGFPLEPTVQMQLESGIGADLSDIRVHTNTEADKLSQELQANAFTTGNDIFFRKGLYNPNSRDGIRLLAHEATHTVQQASKAVDGVSWRGGVKVSDPNDHFEQAAEATANDIMNSSSANVVLRGRKSNMGVMQRDAIEEKVMQIQQDSSNTMMVQRDPAGWSGPSYARHGPDDSKVEQRRSSLKSPAVYAQEYDNSCLDGSKKIYSGITTLYKIATDLEKKADSGSLWKPNDKDLVALGKQVRDLAKGLEGMKEGFDTLRKKGFDFSKTDLRTDPELPTTIDLVKGSIDSITQGFETNEALKTFEDKPSRETANAWATQITKQFSAAKGILGPLKLPPGLGWIKEYFEGLLGAPAVYVSAFQILSKLRYDELDKEAGLVDGRENKMYDQGTGKEYSTDAAPMRLIQASWRAYNGQNLYQWLLHSKKRTFGKINFEDKPPPLDLAKALIVQELNQDESIKPEDKTRWTTWVGEYTDIGPVRAQNSASLSP